MGFFSKFSLKHRLFFAFGSILFVIAIFLLVGISLVDTLVLRYQNFVNYTIVQHVPTVAYDIILHEMAEIAEHSRAARRMLMLMMGGLATLTFLLATMMAKAIQEPISKLKAAMAQVTGGNLTYPIRMDYKDELGMLSHDLADMVESISEMNKAVTVADYTDTMICITDLDHRLIYINKVYADAHGIDINNYEGKICYENLGRTELCDNCCFNDIPTTEHGIFIDCGINFEPRLDKWLETRATVIPWPDGRTARVIYLNDATEKKRQLDQRQEIEEQMQKALEETKAASIAKSVFIANTNHEIRTPMNSILGYSELALDGNISDNTREYLTKIIRNTKWLLSIINDIMDISNIESGMLHLESIPFDISDVLNQCQQIVAPNAITKNIVLHFYAEPCLGRRLVGDPSKLSQICVNILSNAVKFTKYGAVKCAVSVASMDVGKCTLKFEIRDSGIGMDEEQIAKIFEPFVQVDASITRAHTGVGLGLAIARRLVEAMGSKLIVESAVGIGSKFYFVLDFPTVEMSEHKHVQTYRGYDIPKPYFDKGEILIVEDNEMNQGVVCDHLKRVGLSYAVAQNGKEAVDMVRQRVQDGDQPFDLIFMDIHMPVMDGLEASSIISEWKTGTPIVAMTANVISIMEESYKSCGMEGYISKPFTAQELWHMLLQYFMPAVPPGLEDSLPKPLDVRPDSEPSAYAGSGTSGNGPSADKAFYNKMLVFFVKNNQNIYADITGAITAGDTVLAHRLAHNLKSNAGHIQRPTLQMAAKELESELKEGRAPDVILQNLKEALDSVLAELSPLLEEEETTKTSVDIEELKEIVAELEPLLQSGNAASLEFVDRMKAVPGSEVLVDYLESFDFLAASDALAILKKGLV